MARDIAIGAEGMAFDSRADQIEHSVVNGSPPLQCFFGAVLPQHKAAEMVPVIRYTLWDNNRE